MGKFKEALDKLADAVEDLTSLHVQTFTGDVKFDIDSTSDFKSFKETVKKAQENSEIEIVVDTLSQFDGDSYNFVKKDLDSVPKMVLDVHKNAVKAGIETRLGLLTMFKDLISK